MLRYITITNAESFARAARHVCVAWETIQYPINSCVQLEHILNYTRQNRRPNNWTFLFIKPFEFVVLLNGNLRA